MNYFKNDPRQIKCKFNTTCNETNKPILKGSECIYYPLERKVYSLNSKQAQEFNEFFQDLQNSNF